ncbi:TVP38/TMEM64 family protein [Lentzea sp. NPDC060358]|uniref:TVP38/TMEM64 family protein n=1 Tax=Lentzea sp. NPDC060358 TaxID=3347103 RepID=UPI003648E6EC
MRRPGLIVLVLLVVAFAVLAQLVDLPDGSGLRSVVDRAGPAAPVLFLAVCAIGTAVFLPKPVLGTAAGLLFGVGWGSALAVAGFTAGALIAFAVARRLGRDTVQGWLGERLEVVERLFTRRGVEATLVLRLLPVVPFTLSNFAAGVTAVRARDFALGTALGLVPSTVLAAVLGDALDDLGSPRSLVALAIWGVLAAAGVWWGRNLVAAAAKAS